MIIRINREDNIHLITGPNGICNCGENGLTCLEQLVNRPAEGSGVSALQTTNNRYVTALEVYEECVASGEFVIGLSFGDWCKLRLNAEK